MKPRVPLPRRRIAQFFVPWRLRADASPRESIRVERVISVARMFLAVIALVTLDLDPVQPAEYAPIARALLVLFAGHSVASVLVLRTRPRRARAFALTTFAIDLLAAALTLPMEDPNSPFFAFFLFVLASASFRWGFRETLAATAAALLLILLHQRGVELLPRIDLPRQRRPQSPDRTHGLYRDDRTSAGIPGRRRPTAARGNRRRGAPAQQGSRRPEHYTGADDGGQRNRQGFFDASRLLLVVEELDGHRMFRWDTVGGWSLASTTVRGESSAVDRPAYFFGPIDQSIALVRHKWPWSSRVR